MLKEKNFYKISNDLVFKYVFSHQKILKEFIKELFKYIKYTKEVKEIIIEEQFLMMPEKINKKIFYGDVKAILNDDEIINIEIYNKFEEKEIKKSYAYGCRLYANQLKVKENYENLKKVISINLIKGKNIEKEIIKKYKIKNIENGMLLSNELIDMIIIRFDIRKTNCYNEFERFHRMLAMLDAESIEELENIAKGDEIMSEMAQYVKDFIEDEETNRMFDKERDIRLEERIKTKNDTINDIAIKLKKYNISDEKISICTGLSIDDIKRLKSQL